MNEIEQQMQQVVHTKELYTDSGIRLEHWVRDVTKLLQMLVEERKDG